MVNSSGATPTNNKDKNNKTFRQWCDEFFTVQKAYMVIAVSLPIAIITGVLIAYQSKNHDTAVASPVIVTEKAKPKPYIIEKNNTATKYVTMTPPPMTSENNKKLKSVSVIPAPRKTYKLKTITPTSKSVTKVYSSSTSTSIKPTVTESSSSTTSSSTSTNNSTTSTSSDTTPVTSPTSVSIPESSVSTPDSPPVETTINPAGIPTENIIAQEITTNN